MTTVAFIFARGGSKGLPGKNIKKLDGKPLLAYSIEVAQATDAIEHVFVSTDCDSIAQVARQYGAEVIDRPADLAGDKSPEWMAWRHALSSVAAMGINVSRFVSLPATSPLRDVVDVQLCLEALDDDTDIVVTCSPASRSPYFNMVRRDTSGTTHLLIEDGIISRRQDAPESFDLTTVAYVSRPSFINTKVGVFAGVTKSVVVPKERAVDIDDIYDFMLAEAILREKNND